MPTALELLTQLRAAVAAEGKDAPFFAAAQRDAYTQEPLPDEPRLVPNETPVETGYTSATRNPCYRKAPPVYMLADSRGIVGPVLLGKKVEGDTEQDIHRKAQIALYAKRNRIIKETGAYPGVSTDQLAKDAND